MSDIVHSRSTSGLTPKKQVQCWSDVLTDLCGRFDVDPLEASSLEGRINFTTVSRVKLCQIEASQHRIAHADWRVRSSEHPYIKILFQTHGVSYFEQDGRRIEVMPGDCLAYDVSCPHTIVSPAFHSPRGRHRAEGIVARTRLSCGTDDGLQTVGT
jgi:AraC family transcriptional regulator, positive regulator of tynA and feaB